MAKFDKINGELPFNSPPWLIRFFEKENFSLVFLGVLMIIVSLQDLVVPPLATTIWRQAQTAMITDNFVREGFSFQGLYVNLKGKEKLMMAYEFPIYNFVVGVFYKTINHNPFWGKFVSLLCSIVTLMVFYKLVKSYSNTLLAFLAAVFLIFTPISVLMFTAFQPDSMGVMSVMLGIYFMNKWRENNQLSTIALVSLCLLVCGWCKFPILVPYFPLFTLLYFFPSGKFRAPKLAELLVILILFVTPFIAWYLYRSNLTDPTLVGGENKMFFIGDLTRFLHLDYYVKPAMMMAIMIVCVSGVVYFVNGIRKPSTVELVLLAGIPLYYFVIPTVSDQAYYLYPITPITAIFMAKGAYYTTLYLQRKRLSFVCYSLGISFFLFSIFGINHVLRTDKVMLPLAESVEKATMPDDLVFIMNMHDRGVWVGGPNPEVVYFIKRNGWNIQKFNADNFDNTMDEINSKRREGARWLIITWYTPELEPWYSVYLPEQFSRLPVFDSQRVARQLKSIYPLKESGRNFAILDLNVPARL